MLENLNSSPSSHNSRRASTLKVRQLAAQHEATRRSRIGAKKIEEARMYRGAAGDRHLVTRVAAS